MVAVVALPAALAAVHLLDTVPLGTVLVVLALPHFFLKRKMTNVKSSNRYTGGLACRDSFSKTKMAHAKTRKLIFGRTGLPEYLLEHLDGQCGDQT